MAMHVPKLMTLNKKKKPYYTHEVRVVRLFSLTMNKFTRGGFVCKPGWSQDTLTCKKNVYISLASIYIYIYIYTHIHTKLTYFYHLDLIIIRI